MGPNPEKRQYIVVQEMGNGAPLPLTPEEQVGLLLDFLSKISTAWVRIDYTSFGETQQMTTESLRRDPRDRDEDRRLFLLQKAHELRCAENVRIKLINPDRSEQTIEI